jgi:hypothetical protein
VRLFPLPINTFIFYVQEARVFLETASTLLLEVTAASQHHSDDDSIYMKIIEIIGSANPVVQVAFLICLVIVISMIVKTPLYNYWMKKYGKKYHLIEDTPSESAKPTYHGTDVFVESKLEVNIMLRTLQDLSDNVKSLANVVQNLQTTIKLSEDKNVEIQTHIVVVLTDLTKELRKLRLYPNGEEHHHD